MLSLGFRNVTVTSFNFDANVYLKLIIQRNNFHWRNYFWHLNFNMFKTQLTLLHVGSLSFQYQIYKCTYILTHSFLLLSDFSRRDIAFLIQNQSFQLYPILNCSYFLQLYWDIVTNKNCIYSRGSTWCFDTHTHTLWLSFLMI